MIQAERGGTEILPPGGMIFFLAEDVDEFELVRGESSSLRPAARDFGNKRRGRKRGETWHSLQVFVRVFCFTIQLGSGPDESSIETRIERLLRPNTIWNAHS